VREIWKKGVRGGFKGIKSLEPERMEERFPKDRKAQESKRPDPDLNR